MDHSSDCDNSPNGPSKRRKRWIWIPVISLAILSGLVFAGFWKATAFHYVRLDRSDEALGIEPLAAVSADAPIDSPIDSPLDAPFDIALRSSSVASNKEPSSDQAGPQAAANGNPKPARAASANVKPQENVRSIALFGLDRRSPKERGRSDVILILSFDYANDKLKLTSLMRDLYVPIEGHGMAKLNAAYSYGGAALALKTINKTFGTDIRDYAAVDFEAMEKVVDAVGGVDIDVRADEIPVLNAYLRDLAGDGKSPAPVKEAGLQKLGGMQAVAYARIRYVGNADFERTERQRRVLAAIIGELKERGAAAVPELLLKLAPEVETSLDRSAILSLAYRYFKEKDMQTEQNRFPLDGTWRSARTDDGQSVLETDLKQLKKQMQRYLYFDSGTASAADSALS